MRWWGESGLGTSWTPNSMACHVAGPDSADGFDPCAVADGLSVVVPGAVLPVRVFTWSFSGGMAANAESLR